MLSEYPGYNSPEFLEEQGQDGCFIRTCADYAEFIGKVETPAFDIGAENPKIRIICSELSCQIESIDFGNIDYNDVSVGVYPEAKTIFCLSILEHLTNPKFFLRNITRNMNSNAVLYLSTPGRMKMLQNKVCHFHEMKPDHLNKWLIEPLGLKIVEMAKIRIYRPWYFYLTGFRPLLRLLFDYTNIYKIMLETEK